MNIMVKKATILFTFCIFLITTVSFAQSQFGELRGQVTDEKSGQPLGWANVSVKMNGINKGGASTDENGNYLIKPLPPGTYDIHVSYVGYTTQIIQGMDIRANKIEFKDIKMNPAGYTKDEVVIIAHVKPLVEKVGGGFTLTKEEIAKAPTRSVAALVNLTPGVTGGSFKGQRTSGTVYFVDGVRVRGFTGIPQGSIQEISTISSGIPAEYGDLVGGVVNIITRGPSSQYHGGMEIITSELIDPFGYNTFEGNLSGPLLLKYKGTDSVEAIMGFLVSGNLNFRKDPSPSPIGVWKVKDDVYDYLVENPFTPAETGFGYVPTAEYITIDSMEHVKVHPGINSFSYNLNLKLDFQPIPNLNITFGGQAAGSRSKGYSWTHSLFNYKNAAQLQLLRNTYRGSLRLTQTFKKEQQSPEDKISKFKDQLKDAIIAGNYDKAATIREMIHNEKKKFEISNVFYTLAVDYTKQYNKNQHTDYKDDLFKYGHYGTYNKYYEPVYRYISDTINGKLELANYLIGYRDTLITYVSDDDNYATANYTDQLFDLQRGDISNYTNLQQYGGLLNGDYPGNVYSLWANTGSPVASYALYDEDQLRVTGAISADLNKHAIKIGFEYEERTQYSYSVNANGLWTQMRLLTNQHIQQLDNANPIPIYSDDSAFVDTVFYNRLNDGSQATFDKNFRDYLISKGEKDIYGNPINNQTMINIDRYDPSEFSLDLFSPDELLEQQLVSYYGYDYLGNKLKTKPSFDDFFNNEEERLIAPFNPIYIAGFIQDQFVFKDMIFRIGLRVDRFNANQKVLKDKYSLYPIRNVGEVRSGDDKIDPFTPPENIGNDFVVYVDDPFNPTEIIGYRDPNDDENPWYDAKGAEVADPNILALETASGTISPYLVETDEDNLTLTIESFKDYEPQTNLSPRIYFSFPISEKANFFANYDIRVQRPTGGIYTTVDKYYFLEQRGTANLPNAALKPQKLTNYELGFKQAISTFSAVTINAYYNETRDQINMRQINQAYPRTYLTWDNIDFQTAKGISIQYDLRRSKANNAAILASYTLAFADGTGSSESSQASLASLGLPNLRSPYPLNNDYRHNLSMTLDYRFRAGERYNGPVTKNGRKILESSGVYFIVTAISGRPFSKQGNVTEAVGIGIRQSASLKGTINGSRYPWQYNISMKLDKDFAFKSKKKKTSVKYSALSRGMSLNVYLWVQNILDIRNINGLYRYTGSPDDDGFLASSNGQRAVEEATLSQAFYDQYTVKLNNPGYYTAPRLIRLGLILNF